MGLQHRIMTETKTYKQKHEHVRERERQTDRQTDSERQTERQTDRGTEKQREKEEARERKRKRERQNMTDWQADRQTSEWRPWKVKIRNLRWSARPLLSSNSPCLLKVPANLHACLAWISRQAGLLAPVAPPSVVLVKHLQLWITLSQQLTIFSAMTYIVPTNSVQDMT